MLLFTFIPECLKSDICLHNVQDSIFSKIFSIHLCVQFPWPILSPHPVHPSEAPNSSDWTLHIYFVFFRIVILEILFSFVLHNNALLLYMPSVFVHTLYWLFFLLGFKKKKKKMNEEKGSPSGIIFGPLSLPPAVTFNYLNHRIAPKTNSLT